LVHEPAEREKQTAFHVSLRVPMHQLSYFPLKGKSHEKIRKKDGESRAWKKRHFHEQERDIFQLSLCLTSFKFNHFKIAVTHDIQYTLSNRKHPDERNKAKS
jgi:hypothetical protein